MKGEVCVGASIIVTQMSSEMFNDALFYKEQAQATDDIF
ncbi:hypothetical protein JWYL7_1518 [Alkalithermobacter thermoalcaliphilus JW-YL-7 = DSM 7308]|uniref:Uncharacterized protein n=1 Tax=Alkalithermobacter thermoalcaliphilus JW-YL-7 = DSM 7308 TaxID=1121328 RepID=A0A150FS47_CLOPD|nr:hypothetical protein JWYL7_1518 [[Clostridium] paradoxum JW-YL-7 = DSM 7308]